MKKSVLFSAMASMLFIYSCSSSYVARYSVGLAAVESPADAKIQFGETKVISFQEDNVDKYRYEDDYIDIVWFVSSERFDFVLKNKSNHTIKINWDDISYVDCDGSVGRVIHSGVKFAEKNNSQPSTTIPKNASLSDLLLPADNVYYVSGQYGGWRKKLLIPSIYSNSEAFASGANKYVGKKMQIMMPIMIENVQNDYTFEFEITSLLNPASK